MGVTDNRCAIACGVEVGEILEIVARGREFGRVLNAVARGVAVSQALISCWHVGT